jgi:small subunit ribosomal protein S11
MSKERIRKSTRKRKEKKNVPTGVAHVQSTFNNTIITITDLEGRVVSWSSAGSMGFKGSRKGTPFAAQVAARTRPARPGARRQARRGLREAGSGREAAIRSLQAAGLQVSIIKDVTPIPHNGCRPPKRRRV